MFSFTKRFVFTMNFKLTKYTWSLYQIAFLTEAVNVTIGENQYSDVNLPEEGFSDGG